jgi:hypothetical protein
MTPFSEHHLVDVLRARLDATLQEIKALDTDYVLKAAPTELAPRSVIDAFVGSQNEVVGLQ